MFHVMADNNITAPASLPASQGQCESQICFSARFGFVHHFICLFINKLVHKSKFHRHTNRTLILVLACGQRSWGCDIFYNKKEKKC